MHGLSSKHRRAARGFTLADLVITVLIIGILAAVAAPKFAYSLQVNRVAAAARRIKADLLWARQHAISSSAPTTVQFPMGASAYDIPALDDPLRPGTVYTVKLNDYPYHSLVMSASLGGDTQLVFNIFGMPDSSALITVQSGSRQQTVTVTANGEVSVP